MRRTYSLFSIAALTFTAFTFAARRQAEAANFVGFKSPGPGMHFTAGVPIIVFADVLDNTYNWVVINNVGWPQYELYVDGQKWTDDTTGLTTVPGTNVADSNGNPNPNDFYRFSASNLPVGTHRLVARGLFTNPGGTQMSNIDSTPIDITVDAWPDSKTQINLTANMTVANLDWENVAVKGNGHTVTVTGTCTIKNSLVTGLGSMSMAGLSGTLTAVDIEDSIFEGTAVAELTVNGSGAGTIRNTEFRANNLIKFVPSDPDASPGVKISGTNTQPKVFQGNRVGAGRIVFDHVSNWLIGGDTDAQSNVFIGPRAVLNLVNGATDVTVRGNYDHHAYRGGWSQGYNLSFACLNCGDAGGQRVLIEHNFIRGGSWPVQNLVGEFRYNVVNDFGHDWLRSAVSGASIHHNLFLPDGKNDLNEGIWFYTGETGIQIYNNTFDGGGTTADFIGPTLKVDSASSVTSFRNNLVTFSSGSTPHVAGSGTILYADYNSFYSPDDTMKVNYMLSVPGKTEGGDGFAGHDVSGTGALGVVDGQLSASPFAGARVMPFDSLVDEGAVWGGTQKVSAILAAYRARYTPKAGAPVIDKGDPQDNDSQGRRADIGAIDLAGHDQDKVGKFGAVPSETIAPTVSLTAPTAGATLTGITTLTASAMDNAGGSGVVLVQFLVDGSTVVQTATSPYSVQFNTAVVSNASHVFTAKAWDAAGNWALSAPVTATVSGNTMPVMPGSGTGGTTSTTGAGGTTSTTGAGGTTSTTGAGGTTSTTGAGGNGGTTGVAGGVKGGCGCSIPPSAGGAAPGVAMLLCALALRRRRQRRPETQPETQDR